MLSTKLQEKKNEEGFTLIELLVVVIIIGILAAIAIPVFLNQREAAWQRAADSDVRNAAIWVETFFTTEDAYPTVTEFEAAVDGDGGVTVSPAVELTYTEADNVYTITATHDRLGEDVVSTYISDQGGLQ